MNCKRRVVWVAVVAAVGLWGCARGPAGGVGGAERKALEAKIGKLEEDVRAIATARDQARKKLTELQQEVVRLNQAVKERDELRHQVAVRTEERDSVQSQYDQFRKAIRDLVGQAEAGNFPAPKPAASAATAAPLAGNS